MALITDINGANILAITAAGQAPVITPQITTAAALADSFSNPTVGHIGADQFLFNGFSWDRQRCNSSIVMDALASKTASFAGATQLIVNARSAIFEIRATVWSGSGSGTFTAKLQQSIDGGTTWIDVPGAVTPAISAVGSTLLIVDRDMAAVSNAVIPYPLARHIRIYYTWSGTLTATVGCHANLLV